jgi:hypothetical protein
LLTRSIELATTVSDWVAVTLSRMIVVRALAAWPARVARSAKSATALVRAVSAASICRCAAVSRAAAAE